MSDLPVACTLPEGELAARADFFGEIAGRALERRELEDGYALRFAPEPGLVPELAGLIEQERVCCAFLRFRLAVEPGGGPVWLELTGPAGAREFLAGVLLPA
ncbi:MAG TPA: hypothetical protein VF746_25785 [Longimicrobium sp.]